MIITYTEKPCKGCLRVKPLWAYYKRQGTNDGHTGKCKVCMRLMVAARRAADPEKVKEQNARYRRHHFGQNAIGRVREAISAKPNISNGNDVSHTGADHPA